MIAALQSRLPLVSCSLFNSLVLFFSSSHSLSLNASCMSTCPPSSYLSIFPLTQSLYPPLSLLQVSSCILPTLPAFNSLSSRVPPSPTIILSLCFLFFIVSHFQFLSSSVCPSFLSLSSSSPLPLPAALSAV